jgi:integrase
VNKPRGEIEVLPSGALRAKVYAGDDPLAGPWHFFRETILAGPNAARKTEKALARMLNQGDEERNPRTKATVNQLMDRIPRRARRMAETHRLADHYE